MLNKSTEGRPRKAVGPQRFALVLAVLLGSSSLHCAGTPEIVLPVIPPCPSPTWAMVEEIDLICGLGENPFGYCPNLYNFLEDYMRYCEEIDILRE